MALDFKKEYKEFYLPPKVPTIVDVPKAHYLAVRGHGNPNDEDGEYSEALSLKQLFAIRLKGDNGGIGE